MTVDANVSSSLDLFGKTVSDLQENVVVGDNSISGTLKHITDYTGFSSKVSEQSGNYLALHCDVSGVNDVTLKAELIGGTSGEVTLDSDKTIVFKIANTDQKVKVTASKQGLTSVVKEYTLTDLILNES